MCNLVPSEYQSLVVSAFLFMTSGVATSSPQPGHSTCICQANLAAIKLDNPTEQLPAEGEKKGDGQNCFIKPAYCLSSDPMLDLGQVQPTLFGDIVVSGTLQGVLRLLLGGTLWLATCSQ